MNSMLIQFADKDQVYRRQLFGSYRHTIYDYKYSFLNILLLVVVVLIHYNVAADTSRVVEAHFLQKKHEMLSACIHSLKSSIALMEAKTDTKSKSTQPRIVKTALQPLKGCGNYIHLSSDWKQFMQTHWQTNSITFE